MKKQYIFSVKKTFSIIFFFVISLNASSFYAQTTLIPDPIFEQALIDLGIDSDGVVNGQVLTSDINTVISLDVSENYINDLTGIEDFEALEELDASDNNVLSLNLSGNNNLKKLLIDDSNSLLTLDVTNNIFLENLYCNFSLLSELDLSNNLLLKELSLGADLPSDTNGIENLDLSNNAALEKLHLINMVSLETVNLKSGNNQILNDVMIFCQLDFGTPCQPFPCLEVDDFLAAQNNQFPYSEWEVLVNYSEDCSLGIAAQHTKGFSIFPNPVKNELTIISKQETATITIKVLNLEGKLLTTQSLDFEKEAAIDVSNLSNGVYFLNVEDENGNTTIKKFIKE